MDRSSDKLINGWKGRYTRPSIDHATHICYCMHTHVFLIVAVFSPPLNSPPPQPQPLPAPGFFRFSKTTGSLIKNKELQVSTRRSNQRSVCIDTVSVGIAVFAAVRQLFQLPGPIKLNDHYSSLDVLDESYFPSVKCNVQPTCALNRLLSRPSAVLAAMSSLVLARMIFLVQWMHAALEFCVAEFFSSASVLLLLFFRYVFFKGCHHWS